MCELAHVRGEALLSLFSISLLRHTHIDLRQPPTDSRQERLIEENCGGIQLINDQMQTHESRGISQREPN